MHGGTALRPRAQDNATSLTGFTSLTLAKISSSKGPSRHD